MNTEHVEHGMRVACYYSGWPQTHAGDIDIDLDNLRKHAFDGEPFGWLLRATGTELLIVHEPYLVSATAYYLRHEGDPQSKCFWWDPAQRNFREVGYTGLRDEALLELERLKAAQKIRPSYCDWASSRLRLWSKLDWWRDHRSRGLLDQPIRLDTCSGSMSSLATSCRPSKAAAS